MKARRDQLEAVRQLLGCSEKITKVAWITGLAKPTIYLAGTESLADRQQL